MTVTFIQRVPVGIVRVPLRRSRRPATTTGATRDHHRTPRRAGNAMTKKVPSQSNAGHGTTPSRRASHPAISAAVRKNAVPANVETDIGAHSVIVCRMTGFVESSTT